MVFKLETICGTDEGSKANDGGALLLVQLPTRLMDLPPPCELAASQYRVGLLCCCNKAASSSFKGGVIECSSRVMRKYQARFLEGRATARSPGYSAENLTNQLMGESR